MDQIIEEAQGGWSYDGTADSLYRKLIDISNTPKSTLRVLGKNAREHIARHFTWSNVATQYINIAEAILKGDGEHYE